MIMVARGEQGRVWRLDTDTGVFAIKELVIRQLPADAVADVAYQEAVIATGAVPMPRPIRTVAGQVLLPSRLVGRQHSADAGRPGARDRLGELRTG
jgi:hypothetical protein